MGSFAYGCRRVHLYHKLLLYTFLPPSLPLSWPSFSGTQKSPMQAKAPFRTTSRAAVISTTKAKYCKPSAPLTCPQAICLLLPFTAALHPCSYVLSFQQYYTFFWAQAYIKLSSTHIHTLCWDVCRWTPIWTLVVDPLCSWAKDGTI